MSSIQARELQAYISYILEETFILKKIAEHLDKDIFKYVNKYNYSSYNAATGEEVLLKILIDSVVAPDKALILIDEIELGLHPKIQRRLVDVLYHVALKSNKQFVLTTHSPTILSALPAPSRVFICKDANNKFMAIPKIGVNSVLSRMDSMGYPLIDVLCEDGLAVKIINNILVQIHQNHPEFDIANIVNVIPVGTWRQTFFSFFYHQKARLARKVSTDFVCILDADIENEALELMKNENCSHANIYFLLKDMTDGKKTFAPERILLQSYLQQNPNPQLEYHLESGNNHTFFKKMVEERISISEDAAFHRCWEVFCQTSYGKSCIESLSSFLIRIVENNLYL